jgi:prepilin-type N-terminal cleavage/methylation domain-containing protein
MGSTPNVLEKEITMKTKSCQPSGFTLVELTIVVSILGVLSLIAAPSYAKMRLGTQRTICQNNTKKIMDAFQLYQIANKNELDITDVEPAATWLNTQPKCPAGGNYGFRANGSVDGRPMLRFACSLEGIAPDFHTNGAAITY